MTPKVKMKVVYNKIPKAMVQTARAANIAVLNTALDMQRQVKQNIRDVGAIRTGKMYNSVYVTTATNKAAIKAPAKGNSLVGAAGSRRLYASVSVGVHYAKYVEYGTSKIKPRPFFRPAADRASQVFSRYVNSIKNIKL